MARFGWKASDETSDRVDFAHGQLTYLQLPTTSIERSAAFYENVFGWQIDTPSFEAPGIFGQWVEDRDPAPDSGPLLWIHVDDLEPALERVAAHGGAALEEPTADGPTRLLVTVRDPGGNRIGLGGSTGRAELTRAGLPARRP